MATDALVVHGQRDAWYRARLYNGGLIIGKEWLVGVLCLIAWQGRCLRGVGGLAVSKGWIGVSFMIADSSANAQFFPTLSQEEDSLLVTKPLPCLLEDQELRHSTVKRGRDYLALSLAPRLV